MSQKSLSGLIFDDDLPPDTLPAHCQSQVAPPKAPAAKPEQAPRQRHSPTSCAADEKIQPHIGRKQLLVLEYIRAHGPVTDNEIIAGVGGNPNGPRARRIELFKKGLIIASGDRDGSTTWVIKPVN